jgi:hypothetical protein
VFETRPGVAAPCHWHVLWSLEGDALDLSVVGVIFGTEVDDGSDWHTCRTRLTFDQAVKDVDRETVST